MQKHHGVPESRFISGMSTPKNTLARRRYLWWPGYHESLHGGNPSLGDNVWDVHGIHLAPLFGMMTWEKYFGMKIGKMQCGFP